MDSISISNTISRESVIEETSIVATALKEAAASKDPAISNERIRKDDVLLDIYRVSSDAIAGGMGNVWRVYHTGWDTSLAMKRPMAAFFAEGSTHRKEIFIRECEYWINLGLHPQIVSCYYVREIGGVPTVFSEWMDGGSLKDRIADGSLYVASEAEVQERILRIALQAARGLHYAHGRGLIHQDVKPGNLLLTPQWDAKVADFGLASLNGASSKAGFAANVPAKISGYTVGYCPREQRMGEPPAAWMDVYAWALTVLEMYTGKRTWTNGAQVREDVESRFGDCRIAVPGFVQALICRCLQQHVDDWDSLEQSLSEAYQSLTGRQFFWPSSDAARDTADSLNNRALSFLDLGKKEEALKCWDAALEQAPSHFPSRYNRIMLDWDGGTIDCDTAEHHLKLAAQNDDSSQQLVGMARFYIACANPRVASVLHQLKEGGYDPEETARLEKLAGQYCREPEIILPVSGRPPLTADREGNIAWAEDEGDVHRLVFRNPETGEVAGEYYHPFPITGAVFSEDYQFLAIHGEGTQYWRYPTHQFLAGCRDDVSALRLAEMSGIVVHTLPAGGKLPREVSEKTYYSDSWYMSKVVYCRRNGVYEADFQAREGRAFEMGEKDEDTIYTVKDTGKVLKYAKGSPEMHCLRMLSPRLAYGYAENEKPGIFRLCIPRPEQKAEYLLSRIETTEHRISAETEQQQKLKRAETLFDDSKWLEVIAVLDEMIDDPEKELDPAVVALRRKAGGHCRSEGLRKVIRLSDGAGVEWVGFEQFFSIPREKKEQVLALCGKGFVTGRSLRDSSDVCRTSSDIVVLPTCRQEVFVCIGCGSRFIQGPASFSDEIEVATFGSAVVDLRENTVKTFFEGETSSRFHSCDGPKCGCISRSGDHLLIGSRACQAIVIHDLEKGTSRSVDISDYPYMLLTTRDPCCVLCLYGNTLGVLDIEEGKILWEEKIDGELQNIGIGKDADAIRCNPDHAYEALWNYT